MRVGFLGAGSWGTALARLAALNGHDCRLWSRSEEQCEAVRRTRRNERYLPNIDLPDLLRITTSLEEVVRDAEMLVSAIPSSAFRSVLESVGPYGGILVSATKGIELSSGLSMCGVTQSCAPEASVVALSGPTIAQEVAKDMPSAIVAASRDVESADAVQEVFHRPTFRVYSTPDLVGVELGGALKNVIAIAAGCCDGLGFGDNSKAALITRGIAEMKRLGVALGAQGETFSGLSGLGDLIVTCFSRLSRNRGFGEALAQGKSPEQQFAEKPVTVEGYPNARSAFTLAQKVGAETPIIEEVFRILYEAKELRGAVQSLLSRETRREAD